MSIPAVFPEVVLIPQQEVKATVELVRYRVGNDTVTSIEKSELQTVLSERHVVSSRFKHSRSKNEMSAPEIIDLLVKHGVLEKITWRTRIDPREQPVYRISRELLSFCSPIVQDSSIEERARAWLIAHQ